MARFSRFDNLENARKPERDEPTRPEPKLERFADGDPRRAHDEPPETTNGALQRFATDTDDVVRTASAGVETLPTLECGACGTECGKFDVACVVCGTRLDSDQTLARNEARLAARTKEQRQADEHEALRRATDVERRRLERLPDTSTAPYPWGPVALGASGLAVLLWVVHPVALVAGLAVGSVAVILSLRGRRK